MTKQEFDKEYERAMKNYNDAKQICETAIRMMNDANEQLKELNKKLAEGIVK